MTDKQLHSFCKKEYNRLKKENENIWKKHDEMYNKEGMEKASNYLSKSHISERLEFFKNCYDAFEGINKNKETINNGTWIKNKKKNLVHPIKC